MEGTTPIVWVTTPLDPVPDDFYVDLDSDTVQARLNGRVEDKGQFPFAIRSLLFGDFPT